MKLSIIVPVYNCIGFLPGVAAAAEKQQGDDWELLLVDDGSQDGSGRLCDEIAAGNPRIRALHKENGGVSSARNMGLDAAAGEFIGFLDADDSVKPQMYRLLTESALRHGSDLVMGGYEKVDAAGRTPVSIPFPEVLSGEAQIRKVIFSMAFWNAYWQGKYLPTVYGSVWPNLYRRELIRQHGIRFPEGIAIGEDLLFNIEYLSHVQTLSVVNEPLYEYNIANASATRKQNKALWQRYSALLRQEALLLTRLLGDSQELRYNLHRQRLNYAINVGEEQLCVFLDGAESRKALRELCADSELQLSAGYLLKHGKTKKEQLQALLIRGKFAGLIRLWLK